MLNHSPPLPKPEGSQWTDEQWQAISSRGQDILVAAAAGSGKTAVLVKRIIQRITDQEDPIDLDRLLVVTFTNAAAAGMKQKIEEAIEEELRKYPESLFLRRQLSLVNRSSISTLHSFCMDVLRRYHYKVNLDPKFRILDDTEAQLLRDEVLDVLLEERYSDPDDTVFYQLVDSFSNDRNDIDLQQLIFRLFDFSRSHPEPERWLKQMAQKYGFTGSSIRCSQLWESEILEDISLQLQGLRELLLDGLKVCRQPAGPAPYAENLDQDLDLVNILIYGCTVSWESAYSAFQKTTFSRLKSCKGDEYDPRLQDDIKSIRDQVKKNLTALQEAYFSRPIESYVEEIHQMAPLMDQLTDLVSAFSQRYADVKQRKGFVDFSDLEHYCLAVLRNDRGGPGEMVPSDEALQYRQYFAEVLVDEYQDTNQVQESILQLVTRGDFEAGNLFMVGDVKQSIYGFRLAEPKLFMSKYKQFRELGTGLRIDLAQNFRSRSEVLHGTNFLLKQIMNETVGEISYDKDAELKPGASFPLTDNMQVELFIIDRAGETEESVEDVNEEVDDLVTSTDHGPALLEAQLMARKIKELMSGADHPPFQVYSTKSKQHRALEFRDIVILLRATSSWAPIIIEEFKNQGIPVYAELSSGYFSATEISIMMSVLKVIDNPFQDIPLASVLRSPIVGLTGEELAQIRIDYKQDSFYEAFQHYMDESSNKEDVMYRKLHTFNESLEKWRSLARQGSLSDLIWQIYRETGYYQFVGGLPNGKQRQANLRALYDRARQYESTSFRGLFRFLRFIDRMQERGSDLGTARALGEQENVVRIMTIHKSKGLEFPIVFVAGLNKQFNTQDENGRFLLHKELGFGSKFVDTVRRVSYPTLPYLSIRRRMRMEMLAEEMRVLYVALTRSQEKLYLIGSSRDAQKSVSKWAKHTENTEWTLSDYERSQASSYLDWIGPALLRHRDAQTLRKTTPTSPGVDDEISSHISSWAVTLIQPSTFFSHEMEENQIKRSNDIVESVRRWEPVEHISDYQRYVFDTLSWTYRHPSAQTYMAKQSVSELKRQKEWLDDEYSVSYRDSQQQSISERPRFLQDSKLSPAERGTAMHLVMQHLPLSNGIAMAEGIHRHLILMQETDLLSADQANAVDIEGILSFFKNNLGQRMLNARKVHREVPFSFGLSSSEVYPEWQDKEHEPVLMQGVIDCLLEEDSGLVLVDYKTDKIRGKYRGPFEGEAKSEMLRRYQVQMDLYGRAVEAIWKRPLKERYLYFFDGGYYILLE